MSPLGGNDIGDIISAARSGNYSGLATLGDDNTAQVLSTELSNQANLQQNRETNAANRELHQMDNAFNASEAEKSRAFQLEMWNKQNSYNSPQAQKERMLEAGLNPMSLTGLSSQPVQSSVPGPSAASAAPAVPMQSPNIQPAHISPYSARGVDIAAALTNVANAGKGFADTMVSLRNVRNNEAAQRSQSLLNIAKTLESEQTTSNLKQTHDVLTPANVQNIFSDIRRREKENEGTNADIELKRSNVQLNNARLDEIKQGIVESQANIDNMRKMLRWRYYDTNLSTNRSLGGLIGRIVDGTSIIQDAQSAVNAISDVVKMFRVSSARDKAAAAFSFVEEVGRHALRTGSEKAITSYAYLRQAADTLLSKWYGAAKSIGQNMYRINVTNSSVLNPAHGDTYQ